MLRLEFKSYLLDFKFPAGTSRGVMHQRKVWFLKLSKSSQPEVSGFGEAAPIHRLSLEDIDKVEAVLKDIKRKLSRLQMPFNRAEAYDLVRDLVPEPFASVKFGLEMAFLDLLSGGNKEVFDSELSKGQGSIPINGLIWMNNLNHMKEQVEQKIQEGFTCIKLKIGALDFEKELTLIEFLRNLAGDAVIRVDANGAFQAREALAKIKRLAAFNIHSIEQPIMPSQMEAMQLLCNKAAIPIALDEELIPVKSSEEKKEILDFLKPQFLVLKPTLLGGFVHVEEWIRLAEERNIQWWITSALESNLGLNAISQFAATYDNELPQGLGTGQLYHNNIESPLRISEGKLFYDPKKSWAKIPV